jgi:hypothetical protein
MGAKHEFKPFYRVGTLFKGFEAAPLSVATSNFQTFSFFFLT